jgi:DHA2 family multidrug resistance protein
MFNLLRNIGSSVGISAVQALLTRNIQIVHASLGEHVSAYGVHFYVATPLRMATPRDIATLNATVTRQAEWIAYLDDFKLLLVLTLACLPLIALLRRAPRAGGKPTLAVE